MLQPQQAMRSRIRAAPSPDQAQHSNCIAGVMLAKLGVAAGRILAASPAHQDRTLQFAPIRELHERQKLFRRASYHLVSTAALCYHNIRSSQIPDSCHVGRLPVPCCQRRQSTQQLHAAERKAAAMLCSFTSHAAARQRLCSSIADGAAPCRGAVAAELVPRHQACSDHR